MEKEKSYNEYMTEVLSRFDKLSDDEKDVIRSMRGTQQGLVMAKVLGPDMGSIDIGRLSKPAIKPKRRGLATR